MSLRIQVGKKTVVVVEHHHHVLPAWCERRRKTGSPIRVISFDFHTDTCHAFRGWSTQHGARGPGRLDCSHDAYLAERARQLGSIDIEKPATITTAVERLRYDEHIDCATEVGVVAHCYVNMGRWSARDRHEHVTFFDMDPCYPKCGCGRHDTDACERGRADRVIDSEVLAPRMAEIAKHSGDLADESFVLDIDLDVFNTAAAVRPPCDASFRELIRRASIITVAREPRCVVSCRLENETIDADFLQAGLLKMIESV